MVFIEKSNLWEVYDCLSSHICNCFSEQLVYEIIKPIIKDQCFSISSKHIKFSDNRVIVVKVKNSDTVFYYLVRKDLDYKIIVDQIKHSHRKTNQLFLDSIRDFYKKPVKYASRDFLKKFNVIRVFKEE